MRSPIIRVSVLSGSIRPRAISPVAEAAVRPVVERLEQRRLLSAPILERAELTANDNPGTYPDHPHIFEFEFDQSVSLGSLVLQQQASGENDPDPLPFLDTELLEWDATSFIARYQIAETPGNFVTNGNYRASLAREDVTNGSGEQLTADAIIDIRYRIGDANNDGDVDLDDVGLWSLNFTGELGGGAGATKTFEQGDWDYDGDVDLDDVGLWSLNFTGELGLPPGLPGASDIEVVPFGGDPNGTLTIAWDDEVNGELGWRIRWSVDGITWNADDRVDLTAADIDLSLGAHTWQHEGVAARVDAALHRPCLW